MPRLAALFIPLHFLLQAQLPASRALEEHRREIAQDLEELEFLGNNVRVAAQCELRDGGLAGEKRKIDPEVGRTHVELERPDGILAIDCRHTEFGLCRLSVGPGRIVDENDGPPLLQTLPGLPAHIVGRRLDLEFARLEPARGRLVGEPETVGADEAWRGRALQSVKPAPVMAQDFGCVN